jgi:large subunit ribosomal protein L29
MDTEKMRNLNDEELRQQERQAAEQLFRLRFQMKLGQNEGVKKLRELRKDIARFKTVGRERALAAKHSAANGQDQAAAQAKVKRTGKEAR